MGLHIEINSPLEASEWSALATLATLMGGTILGAGKVAAPAPVAKPAEPAEPAVPAPTPAPPPPPPTPIAGITAQDIHPDLPVVSGVLLDSAGLPWDARIHASSKTTTKDKKWTSKRNLDPAMKEAVEAELRKVMAAAPPPPPPPTTDADIAAAFPAAGAPVAPITPPPPPPPPPVADTTAMGDTPFQAFMKRVLAQQTAGTVTTEKLAATAAACGITSITDLSKRPDLIPMFDQLLAA